MSDRRGPRSGRSARTRCYRQRVVALPRLRRMAVAVAGGVFATSAVAACDVGTPQQTAPTPATTASAATPQPGSSTSPTPARSPTARSSASPRPTKTPVVRVNANDKKFNKKDFGAPTGDLNSWLPLVPGNQSLRDGSLFRGSRKLRHQRRLTVTDVMKTVNGVRTVIVLDQDIDAGQIGETALDYLAQDKHGNIWYLGSYTEIYEGGQFVNAVDAWLAGTNEATPGVLMMANPKEGLRYVEARTGRETIRAEVAKVGSRKCVPFRCFPKTLAVLEDGSEFKYYAPGVGHIATEPNYSGGEQEKEAVVNVIRLSPKGLAEASAEALRIDRHARTAAKSVFGDSAPAKRAKS
jgi:hypothetical protein